VKPAIEEKIIEFKEKVLQLEEKCNDNDQYSRWYNVRIYGVNNSTSADSYGYTLFGVLRKYATVRSISVRFSSNCSPVHAKIW
jgi:hypothetical protein